MHKEDEHVQCPYYKCDGRLSIHCEGITDTCGLHLSFASKDRMKSFKTQFCRKEWTGCTIAKMLNRMYDYTP